MIQRTLIVFLALFCGALLDRVYADDCGADVDLNIDNWNFSTTNTGIEISWLLRYETQCPIEYRVTVTDEELGVIKDEYQEENVYNVGPISACILYGVGIRAVNKAAGTEGLLQMTTVRLRETAQVAPILQSLHVQSTYFSMTLQLEGAANRCPLIALIVDGGASFNKTVSLENSHHPDAVSVQIDSLTPGTLYSFQVYVVNTGGVSSPTSMGVITSRA